ncbi:MAG TPA: acyl-CoA dehydrogenase C-terminal domain-containing protein, partial [Arenicellales bacterium]|nr:acyl-CoA dehydrogenase C-terminal domain-containing protein [Arenicellales bacterium]
HPDVQRMLLSMQSRIQAMRALSLYTAAAADRASHHPDAAEQARGQRIVDVLTPVVKGWGSEVGNDITGVALQVHGGMGYIEETGAAQHYRDARITTIYEGTTGIQAADLVGRKMLRDGGQMVGEVIETMRTETAAAASSTAPDVQAVATAVGRLIEKLTEATAWLLAAAGRDPRIPLAGSFNYLMLWGITAGGWQMAQAATAARRCLDADEGDSAFYRAKLANCSHYASQVLPHGEAYASAIIDSGASLEDLDSLFS